MHSPRGCLPALLALLCLTAGCLSGVSGDGTPSPTTTATATTTPSDHHAALDQPDPDKEVVVQNRWNRSVEMHVRVVRDATGETVHDGTDTLAPGTERTVYNVSAADPERRRDVHRRRDGPEHNRPRQHRDESVLRERLRRDSGRRDAVRLLFDLLM
jgi:hypothetical protein